MFGELMRTTRLITIRESRVVRILLALTLFCAGLPFASVAQEITAVANFAGADGNGPTSLVQGADGNFYGTTENGGTGNGSDLCLPPYSGCGTFFKVTPSGTITSLYSFCSQLNCTDGSGPREALVRGTDGNYYGTTVFGGSCQMEEGCGTLFKITPTGTLTQLHSFCSQPNCPDGFWPVGGLVLASNGNFYGTTQGGGANSYGTIFKITPSGTLTTLYNFCALTRCTDGSQPKAALIQAVDGNLYGTTWAGGRVGAGTVFRITLAGELTTLYSFNGNHGAAPEAPLIQAADGNFYGTTEDGGAFNDYCSQSGCGTVFKITPNGILTTLHNFSGPDGALALAGLLQATDGNLYGTTWNGGADSVGTVFRITTDGTFTLLLGPLGGPRLEAEQERDFPLLRSSCIPSGVNPVAYSLNITAVPNPQHQYLGYLTVWPAGLPQPDVSTLNNSTATIVANATITAAAPNGDVAVYASNSTDLLIDINGYFAPSGAGGYSLYTSAPCRAYDSRGNNGQPFLGNRSLDILDSPCPPPVNAAGYVFNATVLPTGYLSYLTLWPNGESQPMASTLNALDGAVTSNMAIVPNLNGSINAYAAGPTQLILDISGYFAP